MPIKVNPTSSSQANLPRVNDDAPASRSASDLKPVTEGKGWVATHASPARPAPAPTAAAEPRRTAPDSTRTVNDVIAGGASGAYLPDATIRGATAEQKLGIARGALAALANGGDSPSDAEVQRRALTQVVLGAKTAGELDYLLTRLDQGQLKANLSGPERMKALKHLDALRTTTPGDWGAYRTYLEEVAKTGPSMKNSLEFLVDGTEVVPKGLELLNGANDTINLSVFELQPDSYGQKMVDLLAKKAQSGVQVRVLLDEFGTKSANPARSEAMIAQLRAAGAEVIVNSTPLTKSHLDHRKVLVVDGGRAFTGGMNIGEHYQRDWHDQQTLVAGPAVEGLQDAFFEHWQREGGKVPTGAALERFYRAGDEPATGAETYVVQHEGNGQDRNIKAAYLKAIGTAQKSISLANPYFADADVVRALCEASKRGVKVQVVLPAENDMAVVQAAARGYYPDLIKAGVEVYEYQGRMAHQKVATIDGTWSTVGSSNLDARSLEINDEMNLVVLDEGFAADVQRKMFDVDLKQSTRITEASPSVKDRLSRFISPLI
jgi:cardiolipin synthase